MNLAGRGGGGGDLRAAARLEYLNDHWGGGAIKQVI